MKMCSLAVAGSLTLTILASNVFGQGSPQQPGSGPSGGTTGTGTPGGGTTGGGTTGGGSPGGGTPYSGWAITYKITGTWESETHGAGSPTISSGNLADGYPNYDLAPNASSLVWETTGYGQTNPSTGVTGFGRAEIHAVVETTLRWTGGGTPPTKQAIVLDGRSEASSMSYSATLNATNGLRHPMEPYSFNGRVSEGKRYRMVKVGSDGTIKFTTNVDSFAKGIGPVKARVRFAVGVTDFAVGIASDRDETFGRASGKNAQNEPIGLPAKNGFQGDGRYVGDTVMDYDGLIDPAADITGFYQGAFNAAVTSIGVPSLYWSATGVSIAGPTIETDQYNLPPTVTREATISLSAVDPLSTLSENAEYVMRIHAALEKETTLGPADTGRLDLSTRFPSIAAMYTPFDIGARIRNNTSLVKEDETFTVTVKAEKKDGWQNEISGQLEFPYKLLKFVFGASRTWSSEEIQGCQLDYSYKPRIAPHTTFVRRVVYTGTLQKWLCSGWQAHGWAGDSQHVVLSGFSQELEDKEFPIPQNEW